MKIRLSNHGLTGARGPALCPFSRVTPPCCFCPFLPNAMDCCLAKTLNTFCPSQNSSSGWCPDIKLQLKYHPCREVSPDLSVLGSTHFLLVFTIKPVLFKEWLYVFAEMLCLVWLCFSPTQVGAPWEQQL